MRKKTQAGKWFWLLILLVFVIGVMAGLAWMGSEQAQKMIEQPINVPAANTKME